MAPGQTQGFPLRRSAIPARGVQRPRQRRSERFQKGSERRGRPLWEQAILSSAHTAQRSLTSLPRVGVRTRGRPRRFARIVAAACASTRPIKNLTSGKRPRPPSSAAASTGSSCSTCERRVARFRTRHTGGSRKCCPVCEHRIDARRPGLRPCPHCGIYVEFGGGSGWFQHTNLQ